MKTLLTTTAVMEAGAGLMLVLLPSTAAMLLFEPSLATSVGLNLIRVAGCAMLSLGVASGLARNDDQSRAAKGLVVGLLLYNLGIALIGVQAGLELSISSQGIWASTGAPHRNGLLVLAQPAEQRAHGTHLPQEAMRTSGTIQHQPGVGQLPCNQRGGDPLAPCGGRGLAEHLGGGQHGGGQQGGEQRCHQAFAQGPCDPRVAVHSSVAADASPQLLLARKGKRFTGEGTACAGMEPEGKGLRSPREMQRGGNL